MRPRILFPHGLGDVVQALPSFRRFAEQHGPLEVGVLERLPGCRQLLEPLPYVRAVFGVKDPWNDWEPANTRETYLRAMAALAGEHNAVPIYTNAPTTPSDPFWSKAARVAGELAVPFSSERPQLNWDDDSEADAGADAVRDLRSGYEAVVLVHGDSGNPMKDVRYDTLQTIGRLHMNARRIDSIRTALMPFPLNASGDFQSPAWHIGAMMEADLVVAIDSAPAHLASLADTPVIWVFTTTPIEQAIPLYERHALTEALTLGPHRIHLVQRWSAWRESNQDIVKGEIVAHHYGGL